MLMKANSFFPFQLGGVQDIASKDMAGKHALLREKYPLLATALLKRLMPTTMKFMVSVSYQ